jgi:hypothetical protein
MQNQSSIKEETKEVEKPKKKKKKIIKSPSSSEQEFSDLDLSDEYEEIKSRTKRDISGKRDLLVELEGLLRQRT